MGLAAFAEPAMAAELVGVLLRGTTAWGEAATERLTNAFLADRGDRQAMQRCSIRLPGLRAEPWWDAASFPIARAMEQHWPRLAAELHRASREADFHPYRQDNDAFLDLECWSTADMLLLGRTLPNAALAQNSISAIGAHGPAEMLALSRLAPGGWIRPHCGPWNTRLTVHLAIESNDASRMRVGDTWHAWTPGQCLVFDDSFEHECRNDGNSNRTVLLFDVWHPDLTPIEREILKQMLDLLARDYWQSRGCPVEVRRDTCEQFVVVVNSEEQCALWPAELLLPKGWQAATAPADRETSLAWIAANRTDMRPLSVHAQNSPRVTAR